MTQASRAAYLEAGWFVKIYALDGYAFFSDSCLPTLDAMAIFFTEPGQYGLFTVSELSGNHGRYISVEQNINAGPDQSLLLPLFISTAYIEYYEIAWGTNYDSSQMRLEFWHEALNGTQTLVWSQGASGERYELTSCILSRYGGVPKGDYFFKVNIVPEPSSIAGLTFALTMFTGFVRKRKGL